jgi:hypothetical protein
MKLDKTKFRTNKSIHDIYSDMIALLLGRLYEDGVLSSNEIVHFVASQMDTNPYRNKKLADKVKSASNSTNFTFKLARPFDVKGLQAVDFISWALFRKLEHEDCEYAEIIRSKIVGEYEHR